eukprot:GEMP01090371.1.p1 GENE.GEMP01090371.1~~GEMP01090371.1.p1  ORF type:complete len:135 (+),score=5.80 GEMP01090371.1:121-525(+)
MLVFWNAVFDEQQIMLSLHRPFNVFHAGLSNTRVLIESVFFLLLLCVYVRRYDTCFCFFNAFCGTVQNVSPNIAAPWGRTPCTLPPSNASQSTHTKKLYLEGSALGPCYVTFFLYKEYTSPPPPNSEVPCVKGS